MAIPRVTAPTVRTSKSLADFPDYTTAAEKLTNLESELANVEEQLRSASTSSQGRVEADAAAVLAGGTITSVADDPVVLRRRRGAVELAIVTQRSIVEKQRDICRRQIITELLPQHRDAINAAVVKFEEAFAEYDKAMAIFAAADTACGGPAGLPQLGIPQNSLLSFRFNFDRFKSFATQMLSPSK